MTDDPSTDAGLRNHYEGPRLPDFGRRDLASTEPAGRMSAKGYIKHRLNERPDAYSREALLELGREAARRAAARKLAASKIREEGFYVHTWPVEIWDAAVAALRGDVAKAPPRLASQRQMAYLGALWGESGRGPAAELLAKLDNEMSEDAAAALIVQLGGRA